MAWLDDRLVAHEALVISADDPGFATADGLFETMLVEGGGALFLDEHLARLERSRLALAQPAPAVAPAAAIAALLAVSPPGEHVLRLTLTARPTLLVQLRPLTARDHARRAGLDLFTLPARRGESFLARHKTLAWNANAVQRRLHPRGASPSFEGLWLDPAGAVLEGTSTNLFAVIGGVVRTPPLDAPILPGIVRARALAALAEAGVPCVEGALDRGELADADELFATSSTLPVAPIRSLDGEARAAGPVQALLTRALTRRGLA